MGDKTKYMAISTRLDIDTYDWIKEDASADDMTMSQWLMRAIMFWISDESSEVSWDDLQDKDWAELVEFGEEYESNVDPEDYKTWFSNNVDGLRYALAYDLNILTPDDIYDMEVREVEDLENSLEFDLDPFDYNDDDDYLEYREAVIEELGLVMAEDEEE